MHREMTDTKMIKTVAWNKKGQVKTFYGFKHHQRAVEWDAQEKKAA
jgi:hypothetical protein